MVFDLMTIYLDADTELQVYGENDMLLGRLRSAMLPPVSKL